MCKLGSFLGVTSLGSHDFAESSEVSEVNAEQRHQSRHHHDNQLAGVAPRRLPGQPRVAMTTMTSRLEVTTTSSRRSSVISVATGRLGRVSSGLVTSFATG